MLGCIVSLHRRAKTLLHELKAMDVVAHGGKRAKPMRNLWSSLKVSARDFAAMEVSNQFRQVFEVIDEDGDGKISPSELSQVLLCLGYSKSIAAKEAEGMVRELDCNGDGFVDLDEFMEAVIINTVDASGRSSTDDHDGGGDQEEYDHLMDAFLVFDRDKNGKISAEELRRVLVKLGCDKCSLKECRRMINGVDKDGDGFVDFQEFRLMMTNRC